MLLLAIIPNSTLLKTPPAVHFQSIAPTDNIWCSGSAPAPVTAAGTDFSGFYYTTVADSAAAFITAATAERYYRLNIAVQYKRIVCAIIYQKSRD